MEDLEAEFVGVQQWRGDDIKQWHTQHQHESFFPTNSTKTGRHYWTKLAPDSRGRSSAGPNVTQQANWEVRTSVPCFVCTWLGSACPLVSRPLAGLVDPQRPKSPVPSSLRAPAQLPRAASLWTVVTSCHRDFSFCLPTIPPSTYLGSLSLCRLTVRARRHTSYLEDQSFHRIRQTPRSKRPRDQTANKPRPPVSQELNSHVGQDSSQLPPPGGAREGRERSRSGGMQLRSRGP